MNIIHSCICPHCKCDYPVLALFGLPGGVSCHCGFSFIIESTYVKDGKINAVTKIRTIEDELMIRNRGERLPRGDDPLAPEYNGAGKVKMPSSAADILDQAAATYRERNALYGGAYKQYGHVMAALFPNGLPEMDSLEDWNRFGVFTMIVGKVMRYATNLKDGGHRDSALDLSVYAAMLTEITMEKK